MKRHSAEFLVALLAAGSLARPASAGGRSRKLLASSPLASQAIIAGVASTSGQGGARYVSSISLANPQSVPLTVTLYVLPAGKDNTAFASSAKKFTLPPGGGLRINDPLATLWHTGGLAAVLLESSPPDGSDGAFAASSRVANVADPNATFGLSLPSTLSGVEAGDVGFGADTENDARYRTNFGLMNNSDQPADFVVELLADSGAVLGSKTYPLAPYSLIQDSVGSVAAGSFTRATLRVTPPADYPGTMIGYVSVLDNKTGDGTLAMIEPYSAP